LDALTADKRDIILLSYFLDMTDKEIADRLNMARSTVAYRRTTTLGELKKLLGG
jgi:RNA polymerase sigma factor (sigma-70 family)